MPRHTTAAARLAAFACAAACLIGCEATGVRNTVRRLTDAGFCRRDADTVEKAEALASMTQHRVIRQVRDGTPYFVYADAAVTESLYIGDMMAYVRYEVDMIRGDSTVTDLLHTTEGRGPPMDWGMWDPPANVVEAAASGSFEDVQHQCDARRDTVRGGDGT